jgi:hypothetical protein
MLIHGMRVAFGKDDLRGYKMAKSIEKPKKEDQYLLEIFPAICESYILHFATDLQ